MITTATAPADTNGDLHVGKYHGDKLNKVDYHWFVVRSLPRQEKKLAGLFQEHQKEVPNLLEVYCPTHTTVSVEGRGKERLLPLFAGYVFVLGTQQAVSDIVRRYYPEGTILYDKRKEDGRRPGLLTIPENQMRFFKDFNENYAGQAVILERPYTDYAFNPKSNEPNEIVKVVDGPLAGREGYLARFRRGRALVFNMKVPGTDRYCAVSVPDIWRFRVVRLHNAEGDRQSIGTAKSRAVDLLAGILQGCGYGEASLPKLYGMVDMLAFKPLLAGLCQHLAKQGDGELVRRIAGLDAREAALLLELARYEKDNPGYVREHWKKLVLRPFLTPTAGVEMEEGRDEALLEHAGFTEIIRRVSVTERAYYPSQGREAVCTTVYYAHVGMLANPAGCTFFANWDGFLGEYFHTAGKANEWLVGGTVRHGNDGEGGSLQEGKLIESFRNFAPTLYKVLADNDYPVKAIQDFKIGKEALNVLAITSAPDAEHAKDTLIAVCTAICKEINSTTHLAVWRRYLRTVWLHQ